MLLAYLHHSHHVSFERLARMLNELFGLTISAEGTISNAFRPIGAALDTAREAIKAKLLSASIIASVETTTRVNGVTHWQWVFLTNCFRSDWAAGIHAGYRSVTGTARRQGQSAWTTIRDLVD